MPFRQVDIIGNGAIGNVLAYHLQHVKEIEHLARHVRTEAATRFITLDGAEHSLATQLNVWPSDCSSHLVVIPVKSYQIIAALAQFKQYFLANTTLLLLHNGIIEPALLQDYEEQHRVFIATTSIGAFKATPSSCQQTGSGATLVGSRQEVSRAEKDAITQVLNHGLGPVEWTTNLKQTLWDKLAVNAIINPLTALNNMRNGGLLAAEWQTMITALAQEIASVMQAEGLKASPQTISDKVRTIATLTQRNYSSMHQDIVFGRETEIEAINGYLARRADSLGLSCPNNQRLLAEVTALSFDSRR
ncbi:ketopantoate reductase family protein [Alteromonas flava]|uniref:ketopantoate reductase family protein n=1 Tax=Alteromonas flava TaxID=2048003 RepID=UPI0013D93B87|nr:2-dehydropantoate 2-reductase [Alteromonas flava]